MSFHEVRFPVDVALGAIGGPVYSTDISESYSGKEQRNINWSTSRARWNVSLLNKSNSIKEEILNFFHARRGRAYGFRFKDWADYQASSEEIGTGDSSKTEFQLTKKYGSDGVFITREIEKPVAGSVTIYLDSVEQTENTHYTIDYTTGIISFTVAPIALVEITADFEFDFPVRFDLDEISLNSVTSKVFSWSSIPIIEIKL